MNIQSLIEMRKILISMNDQLTPYSSTMEYKLYLDNLSHYKKILDTFIILSKNELDKAIKKCNNILKV